jgi:hypothetical protein
MAVVALTSGLLYVAADISAEIRPPEALPQLPAQVPARVPAQVPADAPGPIVPRDIAKAVEPPETPTPAAWAALLDGLGDRDPLVRNRSRETLMLLSRDELPALRDTVMASPPRSPTQRSLLRDVVLQVYLTGEHNFKGLGGGFLGVSGSVTDDQSLMVRETIWGRDAYRALRPSDIILGIRDDQAQPFTQTPGIPALQRWLSTRAVGTWVSVNVLRDGAAIEVKLRLGPAAMLQRAEPAFEASERQFAAAEAYWTANFVPLLAPTTRPAAVSSTLPPS